MAPTHVVYEPQWMIDRAGRGSFRVDCECGWESSGFDTATLARAAAFDHSTSGADPGGSTGTGSPPVTPRRRRFWRR